MIRQKSKSCARSCSGPSAKLRRWKSKRWKSNPTRMRFPSPRTLVRGLFFVRERGGPRYFGHVVGRAIWGETCILPALNQQRSDDVRVLMWRCLLPCLLILATVSVAQDADDLSPDDYDPARVATLSLQLDRQGSLDASLDLPVSPASPEAMQSALTQALH